MPAKLGKKEFRTSVILTEAQFQRVRGLADENDASTRISQVAHLSDAVFS